MRTIFSILFGFPLQIKVIKSQERSIQNLCTSFLVQHEIHIFYNYRFSTSNDSHIVTRTMYKECLYTVPFFYMRSIFSIIFGFPLQMIVIWSREQCIQNVCTSFLVQHEIHIFYNNRFSTSNDSHIVTGTVYTECVYTVPDAI